MLKLRSRAKSSLIITGTALISIGALIAVLNLDNNASAAVPASSASSCSPSTAVSIYVPPIVPSTEVEIKPSKASSAFVPSSGASKAAELTKIEKPMSAPPAPSVASGTNLTDKNKKPSYASSSAPTKISNSTTKKSSGTPKMGDKRTSNGQKQVYVDGFGWIEDGGGGGQMTKDIPTDHDGDINKQVGIMD